MVVTKIVDVKEAVQWLKEGKPYSWIIETYQEKYNTRTTPAMWANFRVRHGIEMRYVQDKELIPWTGILPQHLAAYYLEMLRVEARLRAGVEQSERAVHRVTLFKQRLADEQKVVRYDPNKPGGFELVDRIPELDKDIVRKP